MKGLLKDILGISIWLLIVLVVTYLMIAFVGQRTIVHGESMEDTLQDGDSLIVDKISYRLHDPKRFDVVVFPYQYEKNTFYIKRIIGLPGEKIFIDDMGQIYVEGVLIPETYGKEPIQNPGLAGTTIYLKGDEYFVLGDNRNNSTDSRDPSVGPVKRSSIIGRAWMRIAPLKKIGKVK